MANMHASAPPYRLAGPVAVGIDLGTSKSTVGYVAQDGRPVTLGGTNDRAALVPTAVYFGDQVLVGEAAVESGATSPDLYAEGFKREMGNPHFHRKIRQRGVPPEVLCGFVLRWLKREAERVLGTADKAVITVPAYYNETRRKATQEVGRLAGFEVLDIINEPTAAAIAYGYLTRLGSTARMPPDQTIMVYDLGGGTFDVSVLKIEGRKFSTLATDGDIQLGGRDFDERLVDFLAERFSAKHGADPRSDPRGMYRLWKVARDAKHELTSSAKVTAVCAHAGLRMGIEITREAFEQLIEPFVERTLDTCGDVLQEAHLGWNDIDQILLVGGSSRMPLIARRLQQVSGQAPTLPECPELLVAQGAALHAALRSDRELLAEEAAFDIINVNAHSLGIDGIDARTLEPINTILIPRNTPLPARAVRKFVTRRDNQANVGATVLEGESENPKFCTPIGKCIVQLKPGLPAGAEVEVSCHYRADGLIYVAARVPLTKSSAQVELRRDRIDTLEPLSVWETRLTTGQEPTTFAEAAVVIPELPDNPVDASASIDRLIVRLDFLYSQIGKQVAFAAVPAGVLPVQRTLHLAAREAAAVRRILDHLETRLARENDRQERRPFSVALARAKLQYQQAIALAAHAYIALGRECLAAGVCPPGGEAFGDEARQLCEKLKPLA
jgi:molecular chaperone DnaK